MLEQLPCIPHKSMAPFTGTTGRPITAATCHRKECFGEAKCLGNCTDR
jgi:hypothetical protein